MADMLQKFHLSPHFDLPSRFKGCSELSLFSGLFPHGFYQINNLAGNLALAPNIHRHEYLAGSSSTKLTICNDIGIVEALPAVSTGTGRYGEIDLHLSPVLVFHSTPLFAEAF